MNGTKCHTFREACSASSEARDEVCSLLCSGGRFDVWAEREHRHCSGEFKQLLLTCIKGYGLQNNTFKVHSTECTLYYTLYLVMQPGRWLLFKFSLSLLWIYNSCILATLSHDCDIKYTYKNIQWNNVLSIRLHYLLQNPNTGQRITGIYTCNLSNKTRWRICMYNFWWNFPAIITIIKIMTA